MTHTPGPWEYLPFDMRVVHQRCDHGAQEITWSDADYKLIAAAPELLAVLAAIVRAYDGPTVDAATAVSSHIAAARAAIAKAKGR